MNQEETKQLKIKRKCFEQNEMFRKWAAEQKWGIFHEEHYDWWAFPINEASGCYGNELFGIQERLKILSRFEIAWGWDLINKKQIDNYSSDQRWHNWPIRLYKMCRSLDLFDQLDLLSSALKYGNLLLDEHYKFTFGRKNMTGYFRNREKQIAHRIYASEHNQNKVEEQPKQKDNIQEKQTEHKIQQKTNRYQCSII